MRLEVIFFVSKRRKSEKLTVSISKNSLNAKSIEMGKLCFFSKEYNLWKDTDQHPEERLIYYLDYIDDLESKNEWNIKSFLNNISDTLFSIPLTNQILANEEISKVRPLFF